MAETETHKRASKASTEFVQPFVKMCHDVTGETLPDSSGLNDKIPRIGLLVVYVETMERRLLVSKLRPM